MKRLAVTHIVCTENFAGVERYVASVSLVLATLGTDVTVIGGSPTQMRAEFGGSDVRWLPGATLAQAVRQALRDSRRGLINTHMSQADVAGVVVALRAGVPVVSTRHFGQAWGHTPVNRLVGRAVRARLAGQVAVSQYVAAQVDGTSTVILPGVASCPDHTAARAGHRVVLVAQRLEAEKCTDMALRTWASSSGPALGWRLQIAGSGAAEVPLRRLAERLGIDRSVDFLGFQSDMPAVYDRSEILLATAPAEHFGLTVVEAMAHGLPVVASAAAGHLETVGAVSGSRLFDPGSVEQAARELDGLIADRKQRRAYGRALQRHQQHQLTIDGHVRRLLDYYNSVGFR